VKKELIAASLCLLLIASLGAILRSIPVDRRVLRYDEAFSWKAARAGSVREFLSWDSIDTRQPPLCFLLIRLSMAVVGDESEWVIRLPSLLAGIFCIPLLYALGCLIHSRRLGLMAAALLAVDPNMVDQSQQARMYTLLMMGLLLCLFLAIRLLRGAGTVNAICLGLAMALSLFANQLALAFWGALLLALPLYLWRVEGIPPTAMRSEPRFRQAVLACSLAVLLSLPGLRRLFLIVSNEEGASIGPVMAIMEVAGHSLRLYSRSYLLSIPFYFLAFAGLYLLWQRRKAAATLLACMTFAGGVLLIPFRMKHPFFNPRFALVLQPFFWICLPCFVLFTRHRIARTGGQLLIAIFAICLAFQSYDIESWWAGRGRYQPAARVLQVRQKISEGEAAAFVPSFLKTVGEYYDLDVDNPLSRGMKSAWPQPDFTLPEDFEARAVWVVTGHLEYQNAEERVRSLIVFLRKLAAHFEIRFREDTVRRALRDGNGLFYVDGNGLRAYSDGDVSGPDWYR
jgi:uncharacterized membrane protein